MLCQGMGTLWDLRAIGIHGDVTRMKGLRFMLVCSPALLGDATNDWHLLAFLVSITFLLFLRNVLTDEEGEALA